jgi:large subunit ribosomal protein L15
MKLHELPTQKGKNKPSRRVGRGLGSTKGKTSGLGIKGQKVRGRLRLSRLQKFKQFPFLRGKESRRTVWSVKPQTVKLAACNRLPADQVVTPQLLAEKGLVADNSLPIKILANGTLEKPLKFSSQLQFSTNAITKIEKAGGTIVVQ